MARDDIDDFLPLFLNDVPLMDVRAPVEFARGAFPTAVNLPLLNDAERHEIGVIYKNEGQEAAVRRGHKLVSGEVKDARIQSWLDHVRRCPQGYLYCFRGGMRSHIVQQWMKEAGADYPLVKGGYKALRRFLIDSFEQLMAERRYFVISGRTGTGKTRVITALDNAVDLEALANHRGSSFGRRVAPQPGQIDFENALAVRLIKLCHRSKGSVFVEDESRVVGRCALPLPLMAGLKNWPLVVLEDDLDSRIEGVLKDYVTDLLAEHEAAYGAEGFGRYAELMKGSLARIRNRLGGERHAEILALMEKAFAAQAERQDDSLHRLWIRELLVKYYDPMYDYQLSQKQSRIIFRGQRDEVLAWCREMERL